MTRNLPPVVVIGGGHAGVEAADAAARLGADVVLVTLRPEALVRLSCNPAIGGIGKGHLVREIDALGGLMGRAADAAGIHFRVLNRSRGPAVRGPRAQQDFETYPAVVRRLLGRHGRVVILAGEVVGLRFDGDRVSAVETAAGEVIEAASVVVTTGTFLGGKLFRGEEEEPGGRAGEPPSVALSEALRMAGLRLGRFKTGTPPRLLARSVHLERFEVQPGDEPPEPFSFANLALPRFRPPMPQVPTHLAQTNPRVHAVVRANLDRSPLYTGRIRAKGPRYCPSFEDKVVRFPDRDRHLLHLEPMGIEHPWIYVNGLSTSLPPEAQEEIVHAIEGLEDAVIARYGYAVEYDYAPPTQLHPTLEAKTRRGLFLAGQICGTTGYEEAAGLGLVAGVNAALRAMGRDPWVPDRFDSYLGVMVDDLTTRGVLEPYRMFTSRAEMRLSLSPDTADRRLRPVAEHLGLVSRADLERTERRWEAIQAARAALERRGPRGSAAQRLRRGEPPEEVLSEVEAARRLPPADRATLAASVRYEGYLERERKEVARLRQAESIRLPRDFDFSRIPGLSHEVRERLAEVRPASLGQAARIPGVTPAALALLAAAVGTRRHAAPA